MFFKHYSKLTCENQERVDSFLIFSYLLASVIEIWQDVTVPKYCDNEIAVIYERLFSMLPKFEIEIGGRIIGTIQKKFALFRPKYELDYNGWRVEGDFLSWNYDVYEGCSSVIHISKEIWHWGDTYVIDIANPKDELMGILLVIAIDAANCSNDD